jgi:hypothetical protein
MKKITISLFLLILLMSSRVYSESFYFNGCKLSNVVVGNYTVNLEKNIIETTLKSVDGTVQKFSDGIKSIEKDQIISKKIKSAKGKKIYFQYFLNSKSKSIIKLQYKKQGEDDMSLFKLMEKKESYCTDIKSDWDKVKIDKVKITKEQKKILDAQKKLKKEQNTLASCQGNDIKEWTNCKGKHQTAEGHKYDGVFKKGEIIKGLSLYAGGAKYVGDFKNFLPHGYGNFIWKNGDKYFGEWQNGKSHGVGTKVWKDGKEYSGDFKNDKLHGQGSFYYPDGKKFVGKFIDGKRHGEGTFTYPDGSAFIGKFSAGKQIGLGECIKVDGTSLPCKSKADAQTPVKINDLSGKDIKNISIIAKKWVRVSQYESNTKKGKKIMDKLKSDFEKSADEMCVGKNNYKVLEKNIEVVDIDETPAYGLETKLQLAINGVIECNK